ncbi:uncharacterized protein MKK02DRAFT_41694 [Dioszegia hungarica]|uniref:Uncharacterized protein n=1 Tax=Dioszegia hungarica TaxID=4972 RepID=A0AA38H179_9TREE|nr:uncharacterized protein MKK02DRAFT_41694 [Dioszegia hungarica]KAI9632050.1 hypothetical protein MKK02DRAFT_41694 [Dioszegia hungarica]
MATDSTEAPPTAFVSHNDCWYHIINGPFAMPFKYIKLGRTISGTEQTSQVKIFMTDGGYEAFGRLRGAARKEEMKRLAETFFPDCAEGPEGTGTAEATDTESAPESGEVEARRVKWDYGVIKVEGPTSVSYKGSRYTTYVTKTQPIYGHIIKIVLNGKAKDTNESTGSIQITDPKVIEAYQTFVDNAHAAAYTAVSTGPAHAHLVESEQRSVAKKRAKEEIQTYLGTLARDLCEGRQGGGEIAKASHHDDEPPK